MNTIGPLSGDGARANWGGIRPDAPTIPNLVLPQGRRPDSVLRCDLMAPVFGGPVQTNTPADQYRANDPSPPPQAQPAILNRHLPYRPLPPATGPIDGRFLTPRVKNYVDGNGFQVRMAAAGQRAFDALQALRARGNVTADEVRTLLFDIARTRHEIARDLSQGDMPDAFGRPIAPDRAAIDYILNEPGDRHFAYLERARLWHTATEAVSHPRGEIKPQLEIVVGYERRTAPLCAAGAMHNDAGFLIYHPTGEESLPLQTRAYELFAHVLNHPQIGEERAMHHLGEAHYLLSQGLPFERGTPACVETLIDASMRSTHGVGLTAKREGYEPVWEALFTPGTRMDDYARSFRHFYE
jgi:hypothetical protein